MANPVSSEEETAYFPKRTFALKQTAQAKARIWPRLSYVCRVDSEATKSRWLPGEEGTTCNAFMVILALKQMPEYGLDCLMCAVFARQRTTLIPNAGGATLEETAHLSSDGPEVQLIRE